jgi:hypothetical protein
MPRIRCRYPDCVFLEDGYCGAAAVEIDPDEGCLTYSHIDDTPADEDWDEEDLEDVWEDDEDDLYEGDEEETDDWIDDAEDDT